MLRSCPSCQTPVPSAREKIDFNQCKESASIMLGQGKPTDEVEQFLVERYGVSPTQAMQIVRSTRHNDSGKNLGYIVSRVFLVLIIIAIVRYVIGLFFISML
ncbi:MAG: hypothetical protein KDA88_21540 [Planctomycetaceae bacterium]|nr:hypothetical protein [Planctomycetaceae bacterium]MCB9950183.1 hypothetical protein [Planctomycetaceae bacterium]